MRNWWNFHCLKCGAKFVDYEPYRRHTEHHRKDPNVPLILGIIGFCVLMAILACLFEAFK